MKKMIILYACLLMIVSSCTKDIIRGNGKTVVEDRQVTDFKAVNAVGNFNVNIRHGNTISVKVETDANILPFLKTEVVDETLYISYESEHVVINERSTVTLVMPEMSGIIAIGNPDVGISGDFNSDQMLISGTGNGIIDLDAGIIPTGEIIMSGNFRVQAFSTVFDACQITLHGQGRAELKVNEDLDVQINGNGRVYYKGDPQVKVEINGNGKVIKA